MAANQFALKPLLVTGLTIFLVVTAMGCARKEPMPLESTQDSPLLTGASSVLLVTLSSTAGQDEVAVFADPAFGLIMDVPSKWSITPRLEGSTNSKPIAVLFSPCSSRAPDVLPPCTKIQISLGPSAHTFEEVRQLGKENTESSSSVILEERELDLNGLPTLWFEVKNEGISEFSVIHVMILVNEHVVYLNAYGELEPVANIVDSIRPIEP